MQIIPNGGPLGAEVAGIDMRCPLDAGEVAKLKQAWNDHLVLVLRGQFDVSLDDHMTFSRHFGELALSPPSPVTGKRGEYENVPPEIAVVSNIEADEITLRQPILTLRPYIKSLVVLRCICKVDI